MQREITLKQVGYVVKGEAELNLWGGGTGSICMEERRIDELTTENVIRSINDSQFGCESYAGAEVDIYILYERGVREYLTSASFTAEDLVGVPNGVITGNQKCDFKKLAENYEKNSHVIKDDKTLLMNQDYKNDLDTNYKAKDFDHIETEYYVTVNGELSHCCYESFERAVGKATDFKKAEPNAVVIVGIQVCAYDEDDEPIENIACKDLCEV